jgi:hypothetical protein
MKQAAVGVVILVAVTAFLGVMRARPWQQKAETAEAPREVLKVGFLPVT